LINWFSAEVVKWLGDWEINHCVARMSGGFCGNPVATFVVLIYANYVLFGIE